jgi:IclR family acetate operon transcriptional repressor
MPLTSAKSKETSSTVFKALDALGIMTAREEGISLPDLALALNQPRSNVVRIVHTLQQYGFVVHKEHRWIATATFRTWSAPPDRHRGFRRRYRPVLEAVAAATGELVTLGLHEGNGIIHIDAIESSHRLCPVPVPDIRHSLRFNAMGKLALSRRLDLASKFSSASFQEELEEVRRSGIAWSHGETVRGTVAMALPGFNNLPTEPMLAIVWPQARFSEQAAAQAHRAATDALSASVRASGEDSENCWPGDDSIAEFNSPSESGEQLKSVRAG